MSPSTPTRPTLRERLSAAEVSPLPWHVEDEYREYSNPESCFIVATPGKVDEVVARFPMRQTSDADLITDAVNSLPALLSVVDVLDAAFPVREVPLRSGEVLTPRRCLTIHMGDVQATCLSQQAAASDPATRLGDEFRGDLIAGKHLCMGCRADRALTALDTAESSGSDR